MSRKTREPNFQSPINMRHVLVVIATMLICAPIAVAANTCSASDTSPQNPAALSNVNSNDAD